MPTAVPPDAVNVRPLLTMNPESVPLRVSVPPAKSSGTTAVPPLSTSSVPPLETTVRLAMPPELDHLLAGEDGRAAGQSVDELRAAADLGAEIATAEADDVDAAARNRNRLGEAAAGTASVPPLATVVPVAVPPDASSTMAPPPNAMPNTVSPEPTSRTPPELIVKPLAAAPHDPRAHIDAARIDELDAPGDRRAARYAARPDDLRTGEDRAAAAKP